MNRARQLAARPPVLCVLVTAAGVIVWLVFFPRVGTDLSAQVMRAQWAARYPGAAYLFSWYGGVYPASYALLTPYLMALAGARLALAGGVCACAALLGASFERWPLPRPRAAALWAGVALWPQLTAGRTAFALGIAAAAGCALTASLALGEPARVLRPGGAAAGPPVPPGRGAGPAGNAGAPAPPGRRRWWAATAILALLATLLSPVAGLFTGVLAAALVLTGRLRAGLLIGAAAGLPLLAMAAFGDGGVQPIGPQNAVPALLSAAGVLVFVPRRWRVIRAGALVYAAGVALVWAVPTPVGSNVERLAELLIGPLLAGLGSLRCRWLLAAGLAAAACWQVVQPGTDLAHGNAPPAAPQTTALATELRAVGAGTARVEAVPQYGHWESQQLGLTMLLARGWERQLDTVRNPLFYHGVLTPAAYHAWLRASAVRYVAISAAVPDFAATAETEVIDSDPPYLVPVWHDAYWRLYRVTGTLPLASAPAVVVRTSPAQITLRMSRAGRCVVRVRWSPFLRVTGSAAVSRRGRWTGLAARRAGVYVLSAPY